MEARSLEDLKLELSKATGREFVTLREVERAWDEYDSCAAWCAKRGLLGKDGDPLPSMISHDVIDLVANDTEAFTELVRAYAYAQARESSEKRHAEPYENSRDAKGYVVNQYTHPKDGK